MSMEQSSYQETMQLVHFSFRGAEYAVKLSEKALKELYKLIKLMVDTKNLNIKGTVRQKQLERKDPNISAFHIPKSYRDKFISEIKKLGIPVTELGCKFNNTDDMHFYCCQCDVAKINGVLDLLKDEYTLTEEAKGEKTKEEIKKDADEKFGEESMSEAVESITEHADIKTFDKKMEERCPEVSKEIEKELASNSKVLAGSAETHDNENFHSFVANAFQNANLKEKLEEMNKKDFQYTFTSEVVTEKMEKDGEIFYCVKIDEQDSFMVIPKDDIVPLDNGKNFAIAYNNDEKITLMDRNRETKDITVDKFVGKMVRKANDSAKAIGTNNLSLPSVKKPQR